MKKIVFIGVLVYFIFGLYLVNSALSLITLPDFILSLDKLIILIGAFLVFAGGINYLRASKKKF